MTSPDRNIALQWGFRLSWALLLVCLGCAKSQQQDSIQYPDSSAAATFDESDFDYVNVPDTTRMKMGQYELLEVEGEFYDEIIAWHNGVAMKIIERKDSLCLDLVEDRDYDGNGHTDLLVRIVTACGGNCCGNSYFFVANDGNGGFQRTESHGYDWGAPMIEEWKGTWSVSIVSASEGFGNYGLDIMTERFILKDDEMKLVETIVPEELDAVVEMRSTAYDSLDEDVEIFIEADLDEDGKTDRITAHLWERWGRLMWSIEFGNGKSMLDGTPAKRLGVLGSITEGYHELVVDYDRVLEWTGKRYEEREK